MEEQRRTPERTPGESRALRELALKLWKDSGTVGWFHSRLVSPSGKGVNLHLTGVGNPSKHLFVHYPGTEEHAKAFASSVPFLLEGGPARLLRGAVGTVSAHERLERGVPTLRIERIQGSFKTGQGGMSRSLATRYGGWIEHLLHAVFDLADKNGIRCVQLESLPEYRGELFERLQKKAKRFRNVAEARGFTLFTQKRTDRPGYSLLEVNRPD